jgi:hypothetical protein
MVLIIECLINREYCIELSKLFRIFVAQKKILSLLEYLTNCNNILEKF